MTKVLMLSAVGLVLLAFNVVGWYMVIDEFLQENKFSSFFGTCLLLALDLLIVAGVRLYNGG